MSRHRPVYRPHPVLEDRVGILLRLLARRMEDAHRDALDEAGADWRTYSLLAMVHRQPGLSQNALAERIGSDRTTVGRLLAELVEDGDLVVIRPGLFDARRREVGITPAGREVLEELRARIAAAELEALRPLRAREQERLRGLLLRALPRRRTGLEQLLRPG